MWLDVDFGDGKAGLATVGYREYDNTGADSVARTTTGVVEIGNGAYGVEVQPANDTVGIQWDTGETTPSYAHEDLSTKLTELWKLQGLDINNPMTVTQTARDASSLISQVITGDGSTTSTVTRSS